ncbi:MAG: pseudouridine-5'-phosphate glycosidase [Acidobacteriota bacterium]|nr:MAG: pseudouridine-5'-phosphate glycosidase [Acidobacteriota bacterium]
MRSPGLLLNLDPEISAEVFEALDEGRAVVALESTVISHGLPHPQNLETAAGMMEAVRDNGAVPALIAMLNGRLRVGLSESDLPLLNDSSIRKLSVRDLPVAAAKRLDGATTVATTSLAARAAGIQVFATGGIGGVHRGFSADVSADLPVLASTPIAVVCSGAKAVLDLPATREWLETHGVPVIGFGCSDMPAFYSRSSGLKVDERVNYLKEAAEIIAARNRLGLQKAVIVAVPAPSEDAIEEETLERWIEQAVGDSAARGISGKEVTPFLLSRLSELSRGRTRTANISLLVNNAAVAARLANELVSL